MLPSKNRLEKKYFKPLFLRGKKSSYPYFNLIYRKENDKKDSKAGFVVSSSVSKSSVVRNKLKRRAREVVFKLFDSFEDSRLIIFLFKKEALNLSFDGLKKEIIRALHELKLIK